LASNAFTQDRDAVYVAAYDDQRQITRISRVQKDGQQTTRLHQRSSPHPIEDLLVGSRGLYFTHAGTMQLLPRGSDQKFSPQAVPIATGAPPSGALAQDAEHLYVAEFDPQTRLDRVVRVSKKTHKTDLLLTLPRPNGALVPSGFSDLAVDDSFVYVASASTQQLLRVPLAGGATQELLSRERIYLLEAHHDRLFFLTAPDGAIVSVTKSGSSRLEFGQDFKAERFVVQGRFLYGVQLREGTPARLLQVSLADPTGVSTLPVTRPAQGLTLLGADGDCLYAADADSARSELLARGL
jgi:hypothetical protein